MLSEATPDQGAATGDIALRIQNARTAERRGDLKTAIREYKELAELLPSVAEIQNNLGIDYYQAHEPQLALAALERAHALNPGLNSPILFSGLSLYQLGKYREAARTLAESCTRSPQDPLARTWLVYSLVALGEYDHALSNISTALSLQPENLDLLYLLYRVHLELGQRDTNRLVSKAPNGARVWQLAADQWDLLGDKQKAASLYKEAESRLPDLTLHRNTLEDTLFSSAEQHEKAARMAAEKVATIAPESARSYQISAETQAAQLRYEDAIQSYRKVVATEPDLAQVHVAIGDLLLRLNRPAAALEEYRVEISHSPGEWSAYFHEGLALMMLNQEENAFQAFKSSLKGEVDVPEAHEQLGKLLLHRHDFENAVHQLESYIAKRPEDPEGHYLLMRAYRGVGKKSLMAEQQQLFEKYSSDRKRRSLAEKELGEFQSARQSPLPETTAAEQ